MQTLSPTTRLRNLSVIAAILAVCAINTLPARAEVVVYADFGDTVHTDMGESGSEFYPINTNDSVYLNAGTSGGTWTTVRSAAPSSYTGIFEYSDDPGNVYFQPYGASVSYYGNQNDRKFAFIYDLEFDAVRFGPGVTLSLDLVHRSLDGGAWDKRREGLIQGFDEDDTEVFRMEIDDGYDFSDGQLTLITSTGRTVNASALVNYDPDSQHETTDFKTVTFTFESSAGMSLSIDGTTYFAGTKYYTDGVNNIAKVRFTAPFQKQSYQSQYAIDNIMVVQPRGTVIVIK